MTRAAVLVIDVQQGLCEGEAYAAGAPQLIERINTVTAAARAAGAPVVLVQHAAADPADPLHRGTPGWQLADGLHTEPGDLRVHKTTPDAFERTDLAPRLRERGIDELVVCGLQTEFCVDTTTRRALALGYPVTLVADGHSTGHTNTLQAAQVVAHHNRALSSMESFGPRAQLVNARDVRFAPASAAPPESSPLAAAEALVQRQLDAYNAKDVEAWLATYAAGAEQHALHGERLARGHAELRARIGPRFAEPDLHATLLARQTMALPDGGVLVTDHERIRRNFAHGVGTVEMLCLYEVRGGLIAKVSFALGAPAQ